MNLTVTHTYCDDLVTGVELPLSWCVVNPNEQVDGQDVVVVSGFARKIDAEIAASALESIGFNWGASSEDIDSQWQAFGGRSEIEKAAYSALRW